MNFSSLLFPPIGRRAFAVLFFVFLADCAILSDTNGQSVSIRVNGPANELATTGMASTVSLFQHLPFLATA